MKKIFNIFIIISIFLLAGCRTYYSKPGTSEAEQARDDAECSVMQGQSGEVGLDVWRQCMRGKGYDVERKFP